MNYKRENILRVLRLQGFVCLVHFESACCGSPIPHKRDYDRALLCNNGTILLAPHIFGRLAEPISLRVQAIQAE